MRSIIENVKKIEEENLKEVISLTNENDRLKRRIVALEKDIKGTEEAFKDSYNRGFFDCILQVNNVVNQIYRQSRQNIGHKCDPPKDDSTNTCRK